MFIFTAHGISAGWRRAPIGPQRGGGVILGQGGGYPWAYFPSSKSLSLGPFSDHPIGGFENRKIFILPPSLTPKIAVFQHFPEFF